MKSKLMSSALVVLALLATACGAAAPASPTAAPTLPVVNPPTETPLPVVPTDTVVPPAPGSGSTVKVGQNGDLGSFLVDTAGMTLYLYTSDTPNTSNCYGGCATNWPPLLTDGTPTGGDGVNASLLGTTTRTDGTSQVTYNGWPLYYFAGDHAAGDTAGEGKGGVWYVITPEGMQN